MKTLTLTLTLTLTISVLIPLLLSMYSYSHSSCIESNIGHKFDLKIRSSNLSKEHADCANNIGTTAHIKVGESKFVWFGIHIFDIELHTDNGKFEDNNRTQRLKIQYHKDIRSKRITKEIEKQWRKANLERRQYQPWLNSLSENIPDINKGDTLEFLVSDELGTQLIHNDTASFAPIFSNSAEAAHFNQSFFNIWLGKNTSRQEMRQELLGL